MPITKRSGLCFIGVGLVLLILLFFVTLFFPPISALKVLNPRHTALMLERGGVIQQTWVPLSQISPHLRSAVVVAEDGNFYRHRGIDSHEFQESFKKNLRKKRFARGFSTITMQVAKNLYLSERKTIPRKLLEMLIAFKMEQVLSKERILEIYLNVVEWGKGIYGAEAAANHYFNKRALALSPDEAAFLASILPNPRRWGRWPPGSYVQRRKQMILARMGRSPSEKREEVELPELPEEEVPETVPAPESMPETIPETIPVEE